MIKNETLPITEHDVIGFFHTWNAALQSGNPEIVAELYADNAVLLPTISNTMRIDRAGIIDYFQAFLRHKPVAQLETSNIVIIDNLALNSGVYSFTLTDQTGSIRLTSARFTYVYIYQNGSWKILKHHSSIMPE